MAATTFQPTEKAKIRLYLGYPDLLRDHSTRLESILDNCSEEAAGLVRAEMVKIANLEAILSSTSQANAGLKRVDEIWFETGSSQITQQRRLGRQYVSRISIILGVPILNDYFGGNGYGGDKFTGPSERGGAGFYPIG